MGGTRLAAVLKQNLEQGSNYNKAAEEEQAADATLTNRLPATSRAAAS